MPANLVKGPDGEEAWKKAMSIVRDQYPDLDPDGGDSDRFYALVTTVYRSVCKSDKYSCTDSSEESVMDWKNMAAMLRPIAEGQMGVEVDPSDLSLGEPVIVATKLGRTLVSGSVALISDGVVNVALKTNGVDQVQDFPTEIYRFYRLDQQEGDNLSERVTVDVGSTVPDDPDDSPTTGPMPAKPDVGPPSEALEIMLPYLSGDMRWAAQVWDDIQHYGFYRAMTRHGLPAASQAGMLAQLTAKSLVQVGAPEPEWVQAASGMV